MGLLRPLACIAKQIRPGQLTCALRQHSTSSLQSSQPELARLLATPAKDFVDNIDRRRSTQLDILLDDLLPANSQRPCRLPQGHHLIYFPLLTPPSRLAADGADKDHWPGEPYNRRVWASGSVTFMNPSRFDLQSHCRESITDAELVAPGTENEAVRVVIKRTYKQERPPEMGVVSTFDEKRVLHFKKQGLQPDPRATAPTVARPYTKVPDGSYTVTPTPLHLFQFSALSYNAHYIHYDQNYAQQTDGHRERLVQAPLLLALLLRAVRTRAPPWIWPQEIVYRNLRSLLVNEPMTICWKARDERIWDIWILNPDGELAVGSTVTFNRAEDRHLTDKDRTDREHEAEVGMPEGRHAEQATVSREVRDSRLVGHVLNLVDWCTHAHSAQGQRTDIARGTEHQVGSVEASFPHSNAQVAIPHDLAAASKSLPLSADWLQSFVETMWRRSDKHYIMNYAKTTDRNRRSRRLHRSSHHCIGAMQTILHAIELEDPNLPNEQKIGEGRVQAQDLRDAIEYLKGALYKCPEAAERFWARAEHRQDELPDFELPTKIGADFKFAGADSRRRSHNFRPRACF